MNYKFSLFSFSPKKPNLSKLQTKRKRESDSADGYGDQTSPSLSSTGSPFITNISNSGSPFVMRSPLMNGTPMISETSTESEFDEYISLGGNQVVQIINTDSKEAEDTVTHKRFFVATGGELYYNKEKWHHHSLKTSIELTACGGNFYALLMGEGQPEYFVGQGTADEDLDEDLEPTYYRVGSKIDFLAEGEDIFNFQKSVKNLIFSLVISYFLGDTDISNVVVVAKDEDLLIRRLDPEFCFSRYFSTKKQNNYDSVFRELNFIFRLNTDNQELTEENIQNRITKDTIDFFNECFKKKTFLMHPSCLKILNSEARTDEVLSALKKITETPFSQYENIINTIISDENIRMQLKETLEKRLEIFSQIYQKLVDVPQPQDMPTLLEEPNVIEESDSDNIGFSARNNY
ncbi:hypothetical protein [Legionella fallonii]|uniref:Uncharacterized protein n=1 Tax=Legionella fallonii LLAP-10 TaxID=1212491 RepID=A0A098G1A4_9GAMM|nr:hypothetical protein [Legionella fallonii]CEG56258.1 protein of unknown function [Legionella fallonii LLAP-10]